MAAGFQGDGTFKRGHGTHEGSTTWEQDADALIQIEAGLHDTHDEEFAIGLSNCVTRDGQSPLLADLPFAGFKAINVGDANARTNFGKVSQIQDSAYVYLGLTTGSANAQLGVASPAITAYITGQRFTFSSGFTNTGAVTINVNGVGVEHLYRPNRTALVAGDLVQYQMYDMIYDGTDFILLNPTQHPANLGLTIHGTTIDVANGSLVNLLNESTTWSSFSSEIASSERVVYTTNGRITMSDAGFYRTTVKMHGNPGSAFKIDSFEIYKNGSTTVAKITNMVPDFYISGAVTYSFNSILELAATDYIGIGVTITAGLTLVLSSLEVTVEKLLGF